MCDKENQDKAVDEDNLAIFKKRRPTESAERVTLSKLSLNSPALTPLSMYNSATITSDKEPSETPRRSLKRKYSTAGTEGVYTITPKSSKTSIEISDESNGPVLRARRSQSSHSVPVKSLNPEMMRVENKADSGAEEELSSPAMLDLLNKPILDYELSPRIKDKRIRSRIMVSRNLFSDTENNNSELEMSSKRPNLKKKKAKSDAYSDLFMTYGEGSQSAEAENSFTGMINRSHLESKSRKKQNRSISESELCIKTAVEMINSDPTLIGDGSRSHILPLLPDGQHKHSDLKEITPKTLVEVLEGKYQEKIDSFEIVDCRYPYEFNGGHIKSAINLYTQNQVFEHYLKSKELSTLPSNHCGYNIIIFHCEFSSQRGPDMCRFLRSSDRNINEYPHLHYPELYVLYGGYKAFFEKFKSYCEPQRYLPMNDETFIEEYRLYKSLSKVEGLKSKTPRPVSKIARTSSTKKLCLE